MVWCPLLQTPLESASYAVVLNPSWFCQDFSFFFHLLFDAVLSEGGGESWNMTATLKLLSYFKEKGVLEQNPIIGGEDSVREHGALLRW